MLKNGSQCGIRSCWEWGSLQIDGCWLAGAPRPTVTCEEIHEEVRRQERTARWRCDGC